MSMNTGEPSEVTLTEKERCARENHSEIERRRRNKMTHYINELADMVPQCAGLGRRPDKLTILRMAVSHMKAIRKIALVDEYESTEQSKAAESYSSYSCFLRTTLKYCLPTMIFNVAYQPDAHPASMLLEMPSLEPSCLALTYRFNKWKIAPPNVNVVTSNFSKAPSDPFLENINLVRRSEGCCDSSYRPSFLTDQELKHLVLEAANGFMFVVGCESGKAECIGHSIYDIVHPEDVDKVREQLSNFDSATLNRVLDFKAGTVKKETSPVATAINTSSSIVPDTLSDRCRKVGSVRNELLRICSRNLLETSGLEECTDPTTEQPYCQERCLICIGRLQISSMPISSSVGQSTQQFTVRFSEDGKFTFVDGSVYAILGYKPHELIGFYWWDKVHPEDQASVRDLFAQVLKLKDHTVCVMNRFRSKYDEWVSLRSSTWTFFNPFSEEFEFVIGTHTCVSYVGEGKPPPKEVEQSTEGCSIVSSEFIPSYRVGPTNNAVNPVTSSHWFASTPSEQEGYGYGQSLRHTNPSYELDTSVRSDVSAVHNLFTQRDYPSPAFPQVDIDSIGSQNLVLASQSEEWNVNYLPESLQMSTAPKYASAPCNQMQPSTPPSSSWWTSQRNDVAYDRGLVSIGERYIPQ
ncbi:Helix-loop-helix DNA-binding domain protein [Trichuris suis]|nr:Helix-loop-helix DNA-binding domain protein [Trichuris suis]